MYFGIQIIGCKNEWRPDPKKFFEIARNLGLQQIEPCLWFREEPLPEGAGVWTPAEAERLVPVLREQGLFLTSAHVFAGDLESALPELLRLAENCGITQYVTKCPKEITEAAYRACGESYRRAAEKLAEHGVELLVHNEAEEVRETINGKTAYEFLLDCCGDLCGMQPDIGWLAAGGEDPEAFLWRNKDRVKSLHYKDRKDGSEAPIGRGDLDLFACFQFARAHGIPQIMDMDACTMEDIEFGAKLLAGMAGNRERTHSILCTLNVDTGELTKLCLFEGVIEAPNWLGDGDTILYNAEGRIWRYSISTGQAELVDTGECTNCNNDHVPSPDNKSLCVSHMSHDENGFTSRLYEVDLATGKTRMVAPHSPSFLHGWSPDGKELCYCAFRPGENARAVDVYTVPIEGGEETKLTDGRGYNDGPEYSPDGKHIWLCTTRSGLMQAWRMDRDGGDLTQMTHSEQNNWFPHVSPDGKRVVYLTFKKGELEPHEHLPNMQVSLSIMDYDGKNDRKLLDFFGGQGSINVNSWAPDSRQVALVLYELEHK